MNRLQHSRFSEAPWYKNSSEALAMVGGAGGIGSWVSLLLSRAGFQLAVYDFDLLEEHNIGGQLYPIDKIGKPKVTALAEIIKSFSNETIVAIDEAVTASTVTNPIAISGFDNMEARKFMFTAWKEVHGNDADAIFIDGRLTAEQMQIFCIKGTDTATQELYEKEYLFHDSEVEDAPCTMKQTSHAAAMIASHMVAFLTNFMTNLAEKEEIRNVPFKWEYFIPMDLLDVLNKA